MSPAASAGPDELVHLFERPIHRDDAGIMPLGDRKDEDVKIREGFPAAAEQARVLFSEIPDFVVAGQYGQIFLVIADHVQIFATRGTGIEFEQYRVADCRCV